MIENMAEQMAQATTPQNCTNKNDHGNVSLYRVKEIKKYLGE